MASFLRDLRFSARLLLKNPEFTLAATILLALGIGANTAMFTVVSALLLRPFPYHAPEQLVSLDVKDKSADRGGTLLVGAHHELGVDYAFGLPRGTRGEQHANPRMFDSKVLDHFFAAHARHDDVGDDEVQPRRAWAVSKLQRRNSVFGFIDDVTMFA